MKKIIDKRKMSQEDWQNYRMKQKGIGGSEAATILGIQPHYAKPPFILWLEKTGQKDVEPIDNDYIKWGNIMEPVIRKQFALESGLKVYQNNFVLQHDEHDFMIANLDGEVLDPNKEGRGVLEIKTTSEWNRKEWDGDKVPNHYMAQIQHYMAVTGYKWAIIVVLIGGNKMTHFYVDRDEEIIEMLIQKEKEFMAMIESGTPPQIGGSQAESLYINTNWAEALDDEISVPQAIEDMALEYQEIERQKKELDKRAKEIKNQILLEAKDTKTLRGRQVKIIMPTVRKLLLDSKKLGEEMPEILAQYKTKESVYRDFKIKAIGE
jgi:putative phage-type endonuclease